MSTPNRIHKPARLNTHTGTDANLYETFRRAWEEFLAWPTLIILGFLLLTIGAYLFERADLDGLTPLRTFLRVHVFVDPKATSDLLSTIAAGLITITSITISLLLLALQQSATSMSSAVFDQFLRRRHNQIYFGFFVGLALYTLMTLATVTAPFNPVFGASVAFFLTVVALYLLIMLLYTTINQMRSIEIIETIHDHIMAARTHQLDLIRRTRRTAACTGAVHLAVEAQKHGFVTQIDLDTIAAAIDPEPGEVEVRLMVSIGAYVAFGDQLAVVCAGTDETAEAVGQAVEDALSIERQRDIIRDPAYGIEQLETIAWTSISSAKANPQPGQLTIYSLRDVLARWSSAKEKEHAEPPLPIVYEDNVFARLLEAFESIAVISSESLQHQNFAAVLHTFAVMFDRLPAKQSQRAEDLILRILSALGDHVLTAPLDQALAALVETLLSNERFTTAAAVRVAHEQLRLSFGKLNSRATRAAEVS